MTVEWKDVYGYEGLYQVSSAGEVRRLYKKAEPKTLKQHIYHRYKYVCLSKKCKQIFKSVHRLVAETFIPNPNGKGQVNHINGNKLDNGVNNLEWVTQSENLLHRYRKLKTTCNNGEPPKKVLCVEKNKVYSNAREAAQELGIYPCTIRKCAAKKEHYKTASGFHWEYIN